MTFTLVIEDKHGGVADEYTFEEGSFLIGRSQSADIILPSDNVSRRHARLYTVDGRCYVEDLDSSNGVFVNGRRIHEVHQIQRSAQVKVGDYYIHVDGGPAEEEEIGRIFCRLYGQNLDFAEQVFNIQRGVTLVGRGKDCSLTLIDPSISRIHSKLTVERSGELTLEDMKSSNGTFVNGRRIEVTRLHHGDRVRFGNAEFVLEVADEGPVVQGDQTEFSAVAPEEWSEAPKKSRPWVLVAVVAAVLALAAVLVTLVISGGQGDSAGDTVAGDGAPISDDQPSVPDVPQPSPEEKEIADLTVQAQHQEEGRQWKLALDSWKKIRRIDPLHEEAKEHIATIDKILEDKQTLTTADSLREAKKYAGAIQLLRTISEDSLYFNEAKDEIGRLMGLKPSLVMQADALVKAKECEDALRFYRDALEIDGSDETIKMKITAIEQFPATRCKPPATP